MRHNLPYARAGQTIGLLGGSFDPPHAGHSHITREALKRFGLSRVWWLVSPGNPLKGEGPAPILRRLAEARRVMVHPRVAVTDIETVIGTRYTAETILCLQRLYPGVRFVWLMGADNLASFHQWDNWREIFAQVPIGVLARPGQRISARMSVAAAEHARFRLSARAARLLPHHQTPAWCFVNVPMVAISSSAIRARGGWRR